MWRDKKVSGIILAGGRGERYGSSTPKQFGELDGKPIIDYTIETMREVGVDYIILVVKPYFDQYIEPYTGKVDRITFSQGTCRQEDSYHAMNLLPFGTDIVVIHDAVRPLATKDTYENCIQHVAEYGWDGAEPCVLSPDTISRVIGGDVFEVPKRDRLLIAHTPQVFKYHKLLKAMRQRREILNEYTDEAGIAVDAGLHVTWIHGNAFGHKLTYPQDYDLLESLIWREDYKVEPLPEMQGRRILLLGASGGIGKEIHNILLRHKADVYAPSSEYVNLTEHPDWLDVVSDHAPFDSIINASGVMHHMDWKSDLQMDNIYMVNFHSNVAIVRNAAHRFGGWMPNGGNIVFIGSSAGISPRADIAIYSAYKAALMNFTRSAAKILKEHNIRVNCICPARVKTRMMKVIGLYETECLDPALVARVIVGYAFTDKTGRIINIRKGATIV